jgi:hypothetical protein
MTVDRLIEVLGEETRLIRTARLAAASALTDTKSQISERYIKAHATLKRAGQELSRLAPDELSHLRERHQELEAAISLNLAVLSTARTVSETLIRDVAQAAANRQGRQETYGADAKQATSAPTPGPLSYNVAL